MVAQLITNADQFGFKVFKKRICVDQLHEQEAMSKCCPSLPRSLLVQLTEAQLSRIEQAVFSYHSHQSALHQSTNILTQSIDAPINIVWPIVRRFEMPQAYKRFVKECVMNGDGRVGSLRDIKLISGLPASGSIERIEILDDAEHVLSFKVVGGEHRLRNYMSVTSLHELNIRGKFLTLVIESYMVDIPDGNTKEETCTFTDTVVRCNLQSLGKLCEEQKHLG